MNPKRLRQVLLIEDNPGDVGLIRQMLRSQDTNDIVLTPVARMVDAETHLAMHAVDMILLDLGLPDAQGLEAVRRAHAAAPHAPVVVLTGSDDESLALQTLQEGAQDYLIKGQIDSRGMLRALRYAAERKLMEDALFVEMERAQVTLNSIGDAVICSDNSGNVTFLNTVAGELTGWSWSQAAGRPVTEVLRLVDAVTRRFLPNLMEMAVGQNRTIHLPSHSILIQRNGGEVPIENCISPIHDREGKTAGAVIVFRDVTKRLEAQRETAESRRIYEDLFNNSDAAIVDRDFSALFRAVQDLKRDGVADLKAHLTAAEERLVGFTDLASMNGANAAALRMFGVASPPEIPKQRMITLDIAEAMFQGEDSVKRSEYLITKSAAIPVIYSLRIPKSEEEARRVPIIIIDLSNIRLAEAARQATIAKSQFLSSMSHEIRTPLNGVIGNLELLGLTSLDSEQIELTDGADKAAKALLGLIGNILDFSKIEAGKLTIEMGEIDPAALVEEAVDVLQSRGRQHGIFIAATFGPDVPSLVRGDAVRVRQILLNLIGNAVKFTEQGGVLVSLTASACDQPVCELRFEVHDSGRGFDQDLATELFQPFTQDGGAVDGVDGTGLGLSICKSLVDALGGTIGCEATPGEGASFWFTLPTEVIRRAPPTAVPDLSGMQVVILGRKGRDGNSLEGYFRARGATVLTAAYRTALAFALAQDGIGQPRVDVVVLVPDRRTDDTAEATRLLRERHIVPLLYGAGESMRSRLRQGFAAVIAPDMSADHLDRNIRSLVGYAQARDRLAAHRATVISSFGPAIGGARVLVLEDRLVNQTVISKQLKKLGIDCVIADNGLKGLELLEHRYFDLVLCDCSMPEMNGYDFTRALRRREIAAGDGRRVPVIALTANAFREDAERCFVAGMDDFISKPVTMTRLSAVLVRWLTIPGATGGDEPEPERTDALPMIDFAGLAEILGTDEPAVLNQVLEEFVAAAVTTLAEVEAAVERGDPAGIKAAAHGAKGEARCAAAIRLAEFYAELGRTAADGEQAVRRQLANSAAAEVRRIADFIYGRGDEPGRTTQTGSEMALTHADLGTSQPVAGDDNG